MTARQALRSPQFIVLAATYFCCCPRNSGPIFPRELRHGLRLRRWPRSDLQRRRPGGLAAACCSAGRRQIRRQARSGLGLFAQALGAVLLLRAQWASSTPSRAASGCITVLCGDAALCVIAREYFRCASCARCSARPPCLEPRSSGPGGRGWIFDITGQLRLALYRLVRHRLGAVAIALPPAVPIAAARRGATGVAAREHPRGAASGTPSFTLPPPTLSTGCRASAESCRDGAASYGQLGLEAGEPKISPIALTCAGGRDQARKRRGAAIEPALRSRADAVGHLDLEGADAAFRRIAPSRYYRPS